MNINKDLLLKYEELKTIIEDRAEEVLKEYFKLKKWKFPTDFSLESVDIINENKVCINYYGFQTADCEYLSIDYFLTMDPNTL